MFRDFFLFRFFRSSFTIFLKAPRHWLPGVLGLKIKLFLSLDWVNAEYSGSLLSSFSAKCLFRLFFQIQFSHEFLKIDVGLKFVQCWRAQISSPDPKPISSSPNTLFIFFFLPPLFPLVYFLFPYFSVLVPVPGWWSIYFLRPSFVLGLPRSHLIQCTLVDKSRHKSPRTSTSHFLICDFLHHLRLDYIIVFQ